METKNENTPIYVLACTALIMVVLLAVIQLGGTSQVVYAGSMQAAGGDYRITVSQITSGQEAVWVLDCRTQTMGVYQYDNSNGRLGIFTPCAPS